MPPVELPLMYQRTVLDNGLTIVTCAMPQSRSVGVALATAVGACYERDDEAGMSHFIEHLCFKGTTKRPNPKDISIEIEGIGGILNASTGREETVYWAKVTRSHMTTAIDLLFDIALNSVFDGAEIEKERQVVIEEINMNLDIPQQRAAMLIDTLLWPNQPLGRDVAGSKETVSSISRDAMLGFVGTHYVAGNMVACVAGDVVHAEVCREIESRCANLRPGTTSRGYPVDPGQHEVRVGVDSRDGEQAHICLAVHGVSRCDRRRYAVDALNVVLGGGMSSRLFTEIREKLGLAYDIHSYGEHYFSSGSLVVYAGVDPARLEECLHALLRELALLRVGVTEEELVRSKELVKGRLELRLEDTQNAALWYGAQQLLNGEILTLDEVCRRIDAVTLEDLAAVADEFLRSEYLSLAVVGPVQTVTTPELPSLHA
ncbi:MAG: insulinase family protein [Dehalococcoidia bacterium]|nr:insulinase family protein [Dehalococcoidia bacterium]